MEPHSKKQHKWKKVNEAPIHSFGLHGEHLGVLGKEVLYQCEVCGRLQKIKLGNT